MSDKALLQEAYRPVGLAYTQSDVVVQPLVEATDVVFQCRVVATQHHLHQPVGRAAGTPKA